MEHTARPNILLVMLCFFCGSNAKQTSILTNENYTDVEREIPLPVAHFYMLRRHEQL